jgi:hypothetical protein
MRPDSQPVTVTLHLPPLPDEPSSKSRTSCTKSSNTSKYTTDTKSGASSTTTRRQHRLGHPNVPKERHADHCQPWPHRWPRITHCGRSIWRGLVPIFHWVRYLNNVRLTFMPTDLAIGGFRRNGCEQCGEDCAPLPFDAPSSDQHH